MKLIYENPLACEADVKNFILEGQAKISFPKGRMQLENAMDAENGQKANYVLWCPENFPSDVLITWEFLPIREPGLCILFSEPLGRTERISLMKSWRKERVSIPSIITEILTLFMCPISAGRSRMREPSIPVT